MVAAPQTPEVTFARDVAPLMYEACASCHREGGPAPFSLITYDQVRRRATQIADDSTCVCPRSCLSCARAAVEFRGF